MTRPSVEDLPTDKRVLVARLIDSGIPDRDPRVAGVLLTALGLHTLLPGTSGIPADDQPVDAAALLTTYGRPSTNFPPTSSADIDKVRWTFVRTALTLADTHGLGDAVESALRELGLTWYMPQTSEKVDVAIDITSLAVEVPLNRSGGLDDTQLLDRILTAVHADIERRSPLPITRPPF
ncbi:hypothetical protein OG225_42535 (plasmid) [Nocardia sp. NBC_01377]|uniref:hypothetical protein n=1 Tax=Nocardia sp. NBC_01377 TaxID=2903595 RepID=UPI002F919241